MQPKILVIGSKDHTRANCFDWQQPFPNIEEYDSIIINLQSLSQKVYDKIQTKISDMKDSINTVFITDREIFCIMNKLITPSPTPPKYPGAPVFKPITSLHIAPPTNYDWLPVKTVVDDRKKGTSIDLRDHRFSEYFKCLDRWNFEIHIDYGSTIGDALRAFTYNIVPIARNKSNKIIAGTIKRFGIDGKPLTGHEQNALHLLPPPTKQDVHTAIEIILDVICGEERKAIPPWRKNIEVPRVKEFEQKIEGKIKNIERIQEEISQLHGQIQEWDRYRDLFTATGDDLQDVVQRTLGDIGIKTNKTEKGFPADLISEKIAVEVTGIKGCVGVGTEKVTQTGRFKELYHKKEKLILIANTYMVLSPKERKGKIDFSPEVKEYFEALSICCFTTMTLFQLWKDVITKKRENKEVIRKILTKNGELTLKEF